MRFTTLTDTLLINGVDLQSLTGIVVRDLAGLHAPGTRRGSNDTVPGRRGQLGARLDLDAYAFALPIAVLPVDADGNALSTTQERRAAMLSHLQSIVRLTSADEGLVSLTRRFSTPTGNVEHTARGQLVEGLAAELLNFETGQTELQLINLDGCWHGPPIEADVSASTSLDVDTDVATRSLVIDLPSAGTLVNYTAGIAVQVQTACVLDVESFSASSGIATLSATGDRYWFALRPGMNALAWDGDTGATITYRAAYL